MKFLLWFIIKIIHWSKTTQDIGEKERKWKSLSHVQLCNPMDYTVYGILQARMLESGPGDWADSVPAEPQGKPKNTGVGRLFLVQRIFPAQELNRGLLHCRQILYWLGYKGSPKWKWKSFNCIRLCNPMDCKILQPRILEWVAFPFSRRSSQPRDQTQVFCIADRFFTSWATRKAQEYWSG